MTPQQIYEHWKDGKEAFVSVASSPGHGLKKEQLLEIWKRHMGDMYNTGKATVLRIAQNMDVGEYSSKILRFYDGQWDAMGPEFRQAYYERETGEATLRQVVYVSHLLRAADQQGKSLTLEEINKNALLEDKLNWYIREGGKYLGAVGAPSLYLPTPPTPKQLASGPTPPTPKQLASGPTPPAPKQLASGPTPPTPKQLDASKVPQIAMGDVKSINDYNRGIKHVSEMEGREVGGQPKYNTDGNIGIALYDRQTGEVTLQVLGKPAGPGQPRKVIYEAPVGKIQIPAGRTPIQIGGDVEESVRELVRRATGQPFPRKSPYGHGPDLTTPKP